MPDSEVNWEKEKEAYLLEADNFFHNEWPEATATLKDPIPRDDLSDPMADIEDKLQALKEGKESFLLDKIYVYKGICRRIIEASRLANYTISEDELRNAQDFSQRLDAVSHGLGRLEVHRQWEAHDRTQRKE